MPTTMRPPAASRTSSSSSNSSSSSPSDAAERGSHNPYISYRMPECARPGDASDRSSGYFLASSNTLPGDGAQSGFSFGFSRRNGPSRSWYGSKMLAKLRGDGGGGGGRRGATVTFELPEAQQSATSVASDQTLQENPEGVPRNGVWDGWRILVGSWFNVLLLLIPITVIIHEVREQSHTVVCILCIIAIIPLVRLHDIGTMELALRVGGSRAGLLNASLSNTVTLVVAIIALSKCELRVVQSALIGTILSKLLLVLGICFFAGGLRFSEQFFDATATQINCSLLSVSVNAMLIPAAFHFASSTMNGASLDDQRRAIINMSRAVSVVLILIYIGFIVFQLLSHRHLYRDVSKDQPSRRLSFHPSASILSLGGLLKEKDSSQQLADTSTAHSQIDEVSITESSKPMVTFAEPVPVQAAPAPPVRPWISSVRRLSVSSVLSLGQSRKESEPSSDPAEAPTPQLSLPLTIILLIVVTVLVGVNVDMLVSSMDGLSSAFSKEWLALILLPAVSALAECITAINVSVKDQLTLAMSVAIGSTIQMALFIIPIIVLLGMILGKPMTLLFDPFESLVLYLAVTTMNYVVGDGKSNWMEGVILMCLYVIIGVSFWFYPGSTFSSTLAACT